MGRRARSLLIPAFCLSAALGGGCASDLTASQAHALVANGARLVDVRTPTEFAARHIAGAINLPVDRLDAEMGRLLGSPPGRPLVVYCHSGARAGIATPMLRRSGYKVYNLGTIGRWYRGDHEERAPRGQPFF